MPEPDPIKVSRQNAITTIARLLLMLGAIELVVIMQSNPDYIHSTVGRIEVLMVVLMIGLLVIKKIPHRVQAWGCAVAIGTIWLVALCSFGPNAATTVLGILLVLHLGLWKGMAHAIGGALFLTVNWSVVGYYWTHGILPLGTSPISFDLNQPLVWLRIGMSNILGILVIIFAIDVVIKKFSSVAASDQKNAALHLESEDKLRQLVEAIDQTFWIFDLRSHEFVYVSPTFERIWGRPPSDPGNRVKNLLDSLHPEDRSQIQDRILTKEIKGLRDEEFRIRRPDGQERMVRVRLFPITSTSAEVLRVGGIAEDITERRLLQKQLQHSRRIEMIGTLASGMVHDLNNILNPLALVTSMLQLKAVSAEDRALLEMAERSIQRGTSIANGLLNLANGRHIKKHSMDVSHLLQEIADLVRKTFPRKILLETDIPEDAWNIEAEADPLHQVIMNLCINARDAMPDGGTLRITLENLPPNAPPLALIPTAGQPHVAITVSDTGQGIPEELIDRIFDPFFTTKGEKGTGLGLSSAQGIIEELGGFIRVSSTLGKGACFRIFLPIIHQSDTHDNIPAESH